MTEALYERGRAFMNLEKYKDAIGSFDRALSINPGYAHAVFRKEGHRIHSGITMRRSLRSITRWR